MKVKFLRSLASRFWTYRKNQVLDLPEEEAKAHVKGGNAVAVDPPPQATPPPQPVARSTPDPELDVPQHRRQTPPVSTVAPRGPERATHPRAVDRPQPSSGSEG